MELYTCHVILPLVLPSHAFFWDDTAVCAVFLSMSGARCLEDAPEVCRVHCGTTNFTCSGKSLRLTRINALFDDFPATLTTLSVDGNFISDLPPHIFAGLTELLYLNVGGNLLTTIYASTWSNQSRLNTLTLASNSLLSFIEPGSFDTLTNLKYLNLERIIVPAYHPDLFRSLTQLETLSLGGNPYLATLAPAMFASSPFIEQVSVQGLAHIRSVLREGNWTQCWASIRRLFVVLSARVGATEEQEEMDSGDVGLRWMSHERLV